MPYVKEICDRLRKSKKMRASRWYLEEYDSVERRNEFKPVSYVKVRLVYSYKI